MAIRPTLRRGDRGDLVKELQRRLHVDVDGIFGAATEAALKRFQQDNGLVADSVAGPKTWAALDTEQTGPDPSIAGPIDKIIRIAATSDIARFSWKDRGLAPAGYIKGMGLVYGRACCKLRKGDAAPVIWPRRRPWIRTVTP